MPAKLWNEGDRLPDGLDVLAAFLTRLLNRMADGGAPFARADSAEADPAERTDAQLGPVNTDTDRLHADAVFHDIERSAQWVPCENGCGRRVMFPASFGAVTWTCGDCLPLAHEQLVLTMHQGGKE